MKKGSFLFILILFSLGSFSQDLGFPFVNAGSSHVSTNGVHLQYVIGEIAVGKLFGEEIVLTQGYSYNTYLFVNIYEEDIQGQIRTWPNPVKSILNIEFSFTNEKYNYNLINIRGKILLSGTLYFNKEIINMENLSSGMYILKIFNERRQVSFKLIKT